MLSCCDQSMRPSPACNHRPMASTSRPPMPSRCCSSAPTRPMPLATQPSAISSASIARFTGKYPSASSALNQTFDNTTTFFPFEQSIYADATHEVVVHDALTAFNLTALFDGPGLSLNANQHSNSFVASKLVPFATHFTTRVLECKAKNPTKQIRFIV